MKMMKKKFLPKNILRNDKKYFYLNNMYGFFDNRINILKKKNYFFFIKYFLISKILFKLKFQFFIKSYLFSKIDVNSNSLLLDENITKKHLFKNFTKNNFLFKKLFLNNHNNYINNNYLIYLNYINNINIEFNDVVLDEFNDDKYNKDILDIYIYEYFFTYELNRIK